MIESPVWLSRSRMLSSIWLFAIDALIAPER
jgi:hypothetical protein